MRQISFSDYIKANYGNDIYNRVARFIYANRDKIDWKSRLIDTPGWIELQDIDYKYIYYYDAPGMSVKFDVNVQANVTLEKKSYRYDIIII